ncbi:hypothetical protein QWI17_03045 [Gilvimarinus sp. SDUM040013]|uniref:Porin n=1 Tax=Gilvimarinus gilvus TaxID=3058038 RepID=A0ABU4S377_9GAMM|nr:hypothetical protein [Gilvimarinus sp. SDUM040013]MDO3384811.1 hypothetical protein [Gilvimarinus sp. SDUM040013]MDX6850856.1 hypothetical protein [Gilvimarinus sp. SDUM040013]
MNSRRSIGFFLLLLACLQVQASSLQVKGQLELRGTLSDTPEPWLYSGSGLHRYSDQHEGLSVGSSVLQAQYDFLSAWSLHGVAHINDDVDTKLGITEAYLKYKPLSANGYQWQVKTGGFYPALSLENPDIAWLSPYLYSNSAINSWVGEELRVFGGEVAFSRPGRRFHSPHSFTAVGAIFKANDPAGSLLAWRGFAMHDRQTVYNESIAFADNPAFDDPRLSRQANEVLPFSEVDGRFGYYIGGHWDYLKRSQLRVYYYDNNGDPRALNYKTGQYAWDTKFFSAAWLLKLSQRTRVIAQFMDGSTAMGPSLGVNNDYQASYVLLSHTLGKHRFSARYDRFEVQDKDHWSFDPNNSNGDSFAVAWRWNLSRHWQVGTEVMVTDSYVENRELWWEQANQQQTQWQLNARYRF